MYQRSPKAALRVGARCSWRWDGGTSPFRLGQGESARCCHPVRLRQRDVAASSDKLPPELVSSTSVRLTFHSLFSKKLSEAAPRHPALPQPSVENCTVINYGLKFSSPETRPLFQPTVPSPPESMEDAIILENGRREDNLRVRPREGLDSTSLDSLYSLFHGWPLPSPYQTPEAAPASLAPFRATSGAPSPVTSPTSNNRDMEEHLEVMQQKLREELPAFFLKSHDYEMYSQDVEFINEILHLKTRIYDAYSTFFLNPQGLIKCHRVSKNKLKNLAVASLLGLELSDQRPSLLPWLVNSKGHQETVGDS
ncbi:hypothetical protein Chor_011477 [Crotalus horridus]